MDYELLTSLLKNLLHTEVWMFDPAKDLPLLQKFEVKYCYDKSLQPCFTEEFLHQEILHLMPRHMLRLQDTIGLSVLLFGHGDIVFLVGPYVTHEFRKPLVENTLIRSGFSVSTLDSLRHYYSAMPMVRTKVIQDTVTACLKAMGDHSAEFLLSTRSPEEKWEGKDSQTENYDYSSVYLRYARENDFMHAIEAGNYSEMLQNLRDMNAEDLEGAHYVSAIYQDPVIGFTILRILARKAAERGGASIVEVDEITQRANQKLMSATGFREMNEANERMLWELTQAVKKSQQNLEGKSAPIRKVLEYISQNLGQNVTLKKLAEFSCLSPSYLSARFKEETGRTISEYIAAERCRQAGRLLQETDLPIQEIANHFGYSDNNYFVKVFRKYMSMTPSEYRRKQG